MSRYLLLSVLLASGSEAAAQESAPHFDWKFRDTVVVLPQSTLPSLSLIWTSPTGTGVSPFHGIGTITSFAQDCKVQLAVIEACVEFIEKEPAFGKLGDEKLDVSVKCRFEDGIGLVSVKAGEKWHGIFCERPPKSLAAYAPKWGPDKSGTLTVTLEGVLFRNNGSVILRCKDVRASFRPPLTPSDK